MKALAFLSERISSFTLVWAVTFWVAAFLLSPVHAEEEPHVSTPGFWSPVVLQHQDFGSEQDGYPVTFGDDGHGEMTVYYWSESHGEQNRSYHGYFWQYPTQDALGIAFEVADTEVLSRALFMSPAGCELVAGNQFTQALDPEGRHPIVSVQGLVLSTGFGVIDAVVPAENGEVDWQSLPQDGRQFFRTWNNPPHLTDHPPDIDGIVLRYEPQGGFALDGKSGRGNTPHHWNLLAYQLKPLDTGSTAFTAHPAKPLDWQCGGGFADLSATFEEFSRRLGDANP